jgi:hypothetical protein
MRDMHERSLADFIHPLAPHIPPALISAAALQDIQRVARLLPTALAHYLLGFECRLAETTAAADFLVCASAELGGRQALAAHAGPADHPAWRRVHKFAVEWNKPGNIVHGAINTLWLEFDIASAHADVPPPNVFFGIQAHGDPAIVDAGLALLLGRRLHTQVEDQLHLCMAALVPDLHAPFAGVMLARVDDASPDRVRLVVYAPSLEHVVAYLERVGWQGSFDALRRSVEPFTRSVDYLWLNLDVGLHVGPRLGLECYFFGQAQPPQETRWQALLDRAVERGYCTLTKRDALLAYAGVSPVTAAGEMWPDDVGIVFDALRPLGLTGLIRELHHLKLIFESTSLVEMKAYLCARYR